ncbi:MAG TPA: phosphodiester glycosidase family protein [Candidatus Atribacteria bacterium]|nr:phosphodiester glycosidase family protein [Candidatus Atribacteria bacterium]
MKKKQLKLIFFLLVIFSFFSISVQAQDVVTWRDFSQELTRLLQLPSGRIPDFGEGEKPISRLEAAKMVIQALSYQDLLSFVDTKDVPFSDLANISSEEQKWMVLASTLEPPLYQGDSGGRLRPKDPLTRGEFSQLKERISHYARGEVKWQREKAINQYLTLLIKKEGFSPSPSIETPEAKGEVMLQVGAFQDQERAERTSTWLKELGYTVQMKKEGDLFKVRVGPYSREEAPQVSARLQKQGFVSYQVAVETTPVTTAVAPTTPLGPFFSLGLLFDPYSPLRLEIALAQDKVLEREKTSEIARRKGAVFAVNAGFFAQDGDPLGTLMIDGRILSEPQEGWYNVGITEDNQLLFGELKLRAQAQAENGTTYSIAGINRRNNGKELVFYDHFLGEKTPQQEGIESIIVRGRVIETKKSEGGTVIPTDGFILQGKGEASQWMWQNLIPGSAVKVKMSIYPQDEGWEKWKEVKYILSSGPLLFRNGQPGPFGNFNEKIVTEKHPRTIIAQTEEGKILFLVVDGRNPAHSVGLTIPELVEELKNYRVVNALNLDGGGSTTFYLQGQILNQPSDLLGERKVSTAFIIR